MHSIMKAICKMYHHRKKEIAFMFTVLIYFCLRMVSSNVFLQCFTLYALLFHLVTNSESCLTDGDLTFIGDHVIPIWIGHFKTCSLHGGKESISLSCILLISTYFLHFLSQITGITDQYSRLNKVDIEP